MAQFSEQHKQLAAQLLTTAATLERGYQAFIGSGNLEVFQLQVNEMNKLHRQWLSDLESFKSSLRAQGAEPKGDQEKTGAMPPSHRMSPAFRDTNAIASNATPHLKRGSALAVKGEHPARSSASAVSSPCACSRLD